MSKILIDFYGEKINIKEPKDFQSLKKKISEQYLFSPEEVNEFRIYYLNNTEKKIILDEKDYMEYKKLKSQSKKIIIEVSESSKIFTESVKNEKAEYNQLKKEIKEDTTQLKLKKTEVKKQMEQLKEDVQNIKEKFDKKKEDIKIEYQKEMSEIKMKNKELKKLQKKLKIKDPNPKLSTTSSTNKKINGKGKTVIYASQIATPKGKSALFGEEMKKITIIENGAIYIEDGIIKKVGPKDEVMQYINLINKGKNEEIRIIDAMGHSVIPGFVDSHTHFIFGGYREEEFMWRLAGMEYIEIMKRGGGIQSTVNATREATYETLYESGWNRLQSMLSQGITTVEGKSGYGLDKECELKQLLVMKDLNEKQPVDIISTYLGAHAPSDLFKKDNEAYIKFMIEDVLPEVKKKNLAEFCDVFCEDYVFNIEESKKLLIAAKNMGFKLKLHADEIVTFGGAELAGSLKSVSADHLLMISDKGIESLKNNKVIATLLPCTAFCLNKPFAPARKIIDGGCAVALASDLNPGSCFANSIALMLALAVIKMGMTIEEAICGLTLNGAAALGLAENVGSIEEGKKADIVILDYPSYKFLIYHTGTNIVHQVIKGGDVVFEDKICKI